MELFGDLSFSFIMDLYRLKEKAIKTRDNTAIENLKKNYPGLFTEEFKEFIENVEESIEYLKEKYGENYQEMLEKEGNGQKLIH